MLRSRVSVSFGSCVSSMMLFLLLSLVLSVTLTGVQAQSAPPPPMGLLLLKSTSLQGKSLSVRWHSPFCISSEPTELEYTFKISVYDPEDDGALLYSEDLGDDRAVKCSDGGGFQNLQYSVDHTLSSHEGYDYGAGLGGLPSGTTQYYVSLPSEDNSQNTNALSLTPYKTYWIGVQSRRKGDSSMLSMSTPYLTVTPTPTAKGSGIIQAERSGINEEAFVPHRFFDNSQFGSDLAYFGKAQHAVTLDANKDGRMDVFVVQEDNRNLLVLNNLRGSGAEGGYADHLGFQGGYDNFDHYDKAWTFDYVPGIASGVLTGFTEESASRRAVVFDANGDGWDDIFVVRDCKNELLLNNAGSGSMFTSSFTQDIGGQIDNHCESSRAAVAFDADGDGDLDLYVVNDNGANNFYLNNGQGSFTLDSGLAGDPGNYANGDATGKTSGSRDNGVVAFDCDGDGDLDLYVISGYDAESLNAADMLPNHLYINDGQGHFTEADGGLATVVFPEYNSVDVAVADYDGDGDLDVYVVNQFDKNQLFLNNGQCSFTESDEGDATSVEENGFGVTPCDLDGDGDIDLVLDYDKVLLNDGESY